MKVLQFICTTKSTMEMTWSPMWQEVRLEEAMSSEPLLITGVCPFMESSPLSHVHWLSDPWFALPYALIVMYSSPPKKQWTFLFM